MQRDLIKSLQDDLISRLFQFDTKLIAKYKYIPYIAVVADAKALEFMKTTQLVASVYENRSNKPLLAQSRQIVEAHIAEGNGFSGDGQVIAVLDSGVENTHSFLTGKVVSEACYSRPSVIEEFPPFTDETINQCPNGQTGPNTALPCTGNDGCDHGTHVAGIAAGNGAASGIAKDADLIAIQVFTRYTRRYNYGLISNSIVAEDIDIIAGLDRVIELQDTTELNISAVNLSIGRNPQTSECGSNRTAYKNAMETLKSYSIATIIASGNENSTNGISVPGCVDPAVSVGATNDGSSISVYSATPLDGIWVCPSNSACYGQGSNSADFLDLLAPGALINSSIKNNLFGNKVGTSMAAPHVTGAWAVINQRFPNATVDQILNALKVTGKPIMDTRSGANNRIKPRINIDQAITYLEQTLTNTKFDFDGDGITDASVFRPGEENWYFRNDPNIYHFGLATDKPVSADYDGDGKTDLAVWRDGTGEWFFFDTTTMTFNGFAFGAPGDIPAPGDFNGDGKAEAAVFRPDTGSTPNIWYVRNPDGTANTTAFGIAEDEPVVEDYDGDGIDDIAVFRPSTNFWHLNRSSAGYSAIQWGISGDKTVQGDYTGDGKADVAVWRETDKNWYIVRSEDLSSYVVNYGSSGDIPLQGDFDGDGKQDPAVFRPTNGFWYSLGSTAGHQQFPYGSNGDIPIPSIFNRP